MYTKLRQIIKPQNRRQITIDYILDIHVDCRENGDIPNITNQKSNICVVPGDVGDPCHKNFDIFFNKLSKQYEYIYFVAGNNDYNSSPLYDELNVKRYKPIIKKVLSQYKNIYFLDETMQVHPTSLVFIGSTLYSEIIEPLDKNNMKLIKKHNNEYIEDKLWLERTLNMCDYSYRFNPRIVVTHYVPSYSLIEKYYLDRYSCHITSMFASNLDDIIKRADVWLCGHTHSVLEKKIGNTICGINAVGPEVDEYLVKTIDLGKIPNYNE